METEPFKKMQWFYIGGNRKMMNILIGFETSELSFTSNHSELFTTFGFPD